MQNEKKIMLVFGTRPEAIKMGPVAAELKKRENVETVICVTGQHRQMLDQVLRSFQIVPDYDLSIMKSQQTLFDITSAVLLNIGEVLKECKPDIVLVHGDTTTTFAAALACFYLNIPVGHIEAGLRTFDVHFPYPEEFNRQATGVIADYHFCPTDKARDNLLKEGKPANRLFVTGNTAIDALKMTVKEHYEQPLLKWAKGSRLIILTAHRRENLGAPLYQMLRAIKRVTEAVGDIKVIYPVHMNPQIGSVAQEVLGGQDRIKLVEPLDVLDFHNILAKAYLVLTDSGGIQEEAPALNIPVLVMRDVTERPEGVEAGTLMLVGTEEDRIYQGCMQLLSDDKRYTQMSQAPNPYGDGYASQRIADILLDTL